MCLITHVDEICDRTAQEEGRTEKGDCLFNAHRFHILNDIISKLLFQHQDMQVPLQNVSQCFSSFNLHGAISKPRLGEIVSIAPNTCGIAVRDVFITQEG